MTSRQPETTAWGPISSEIRRDRKQLNYGDYGGVDVTSPPLGDYGNPRLSPTLPLPSSMMTEIADQYDPRGYRSETYRRGRDVSQHDAMTPDDEQQKQYSKERNKCQSSILTTKDVKYIGFISLLCSLLVYAQEQTDRSTKSKIVRSIKIGSGIAGITLAIVATMRTISWIRQSSS